MLGRQERVNRKAIPARRGRLFEQDYTRTGSDGAERRIGPYYVLTRSVNGKTVSGRVRRQDAPRVREELARGETLAGLVEKPWEEAALPFAARTLGALNVLWVRALIKDGHHDPYGDTRRNRSRSRTAA